MVKQNVREVQSNGDSLQYPLKDFCLLTAKKKTENYQSPQFCFYKQNSNVLPILCQKLQHDFSSQLTTTILQGKKEKGKFRFFQLLGMPF